MLRPDEDARRLSISRAAVYRLIASGTIPSVRLGGSRRVSQTQLSQLINGLELDGGLTHPKRPTSSAQTSGILHGSTTAGTARHGSGQHPTWECHDCAAERRLAP